MSDSRATKHQQVKQQLLEELQAEKFTIGQQYYSEPELIEMFSVSRGTIRKALEDLQQAGILVRQSGIGTRVARIPRQRYERPMEVFSLTLQIEGAGLVPSTKVLRAESITPNGDAGRTLDCFTPGEPLYCIQRQRLGNGIPIAVQTIYVRHQDCPGLLDEDLTQSLMKLYDAKYDRRIESADEILRVIAAEPEDAGPLLVPFDTPIVIRSRISYDQHEMPFEVLYSVERMGFFDYRYRYHQANKA